MPKHDIDDLRTMHTAVLGIERATEGVAGTIRKLGEALQDLGYDHVHCLDDVASAVEGAMDEAFCDLRGQLEADIQDAEAEDGVAKLPDKAGRINPATGMVYGAIATERGGKPTG